MPWYASIYKKQYGDNVFQKESIAFNPLIDYSILDIWRIHKENGIYRNKIYDNLCSSRSGCFPCINSRRCEKLLILSKPKYKRDANRWLNFETILSDLNQRPMTFFPETREEILQQGETPLLDYDDPEILGCEGYMQKCGL